MTEGPSTIRKVKGMERGRAMSLGGLEDVSKRKREESGEGNRKMMEEIFKRSRITPRSPEKREETSEEEIEEVMRRWRGEIGEVMEEIRGMRGWREEFKQMREELKEGIREQGGWMREELETLRRDLRERETKWKGEKEELKKCIRELEEKVEVLEMEGEEKGKGSEVDNREGKGRGGMEKKVKKMERKLEMKEREERRKNIVIRGLEVREGRRREAVDEVLGAMGMKAEIEGIWRVGRAGEEGREMVVVKFGVEKIRNEVLERRRLLRGRKERVMEDWTWEERKMRNLEEVARREERRGKQVRIGYGRIKIGEQWWKWDEEEEVLRDSRGKEKENEGKKLEGSGKG